MGRENKKISAKVTSAPSVLYNIFMQKKFYITTAIPYVNGRPHIGHALEYFQADTIRRYHQIKGEETCLLSGADENALKNVQAAEKENLDTQAYLDKYAKIWKDSYDKLGVRLDVFQRGSDKKLHWPGVQQLWSRCNKNGDIYKKSYEGMYCVGCESFKTNEELVGGLCPEHQKAPEYVKEENYFFRLSKYQTSLISLIESGKLEIIPENKKTETLSFIKQGLEDFSISRSNKRAKGVGVPVPGDEGQKIYVWFDALNIYMTGVGFGTNEQEWEKWWPADLHVIGKDINRFHTVYWPAMLMSAGVPLPKKVLIHSFVNASGGEKLSKSLGNSPDPFEITDKYGVEPFRYYLLSQIPLANDGNFSVERLTEVYSANLANGLGNLVSRIAKLCETSGENFEEINTDSYNISPQVIDKLNRFQFSEALSIIWVSISDTDKSISDDKPWTLKGEKLKKSLSKHVLCIRQIATDLQPFLPETSDKILKQFSGPTIKSAAPLFPRIQ